MFIKIVREEDRAIRETKRKKCKKSRNKRNDLVRVSKKSHYQPFLEANKKSKNFNGKEVAKSYILERIAIDSVLRVYLLKEKHSKP